jgi:hypothetical protein
MPKTLLILPIVVSLFTFVMTGKAVADLPEEGSGQMVVDEVCEGIRQYRKEKDWEKRLKRLEKLAATHDPRVAVVIGDAMEVGRVVRGDFSVREALKCNRLLEKYYLPPSSDEEGFSWWELNRDDLRRRAKQLPE